LTGLLPNCLFRLPSFEAGRIWQSSGGVKVDLVTEFRTFRQLNLRRFSVVLQGFLAIGGEPRGRC